MNTRCYQGETRVDRIDPRHRGIAYGDGIFETTRVHDGAIHWWPAHWARLLRGAERLGLRLPDAGFVAAEAQAMLAGCHAGVLKLVVSRGLGGRGYQPSVDAPPQWQLSLHDVPIVMAEAGLHLRWCQTRLAVQPQLAGIKHCNRLEQVLARLEWRQPDAPDVAADEGLMCDTDGHVVCATAANVFALRGDRWLTPAVDRCGVAGVCRDWVIGALGAVEARVSRADIETADAVFLCNAVRGILPAAQLRDRLWAPHPAIAETRRLLGDAHPAFRVPASLDTVELP